MTNEKLRSCIDKLNTDKNDKDAADALDRWLEGRAACKPATPLDLGDLTKARDFLEALICCSRCGRTLEILPMRRGGGASEDAPPASIPLGRGKA